MAKSDLQDSVKKKVQEMAQILKVVREDLRKLINYEATMTTKIIDFCEIYGIESGDIEEFDIVIVPQQVKIPFKDLFEVFPNFDIKAIVDNIIAEINIDMPQTEQNLRFSADFQEPIIKGIMKQLDQLTTISKKEVKLK